MTGRAGRRALLGILAVEQQVKGMTVDCYRRWLPAVEAQVLPVLTASLEVPPDPEAVRLTQTVWEQILDDVFLHGMGVVLLSEIVDRLLARGVTELPAGWIAGADVTPVSVEALQALPALAEWQTEYLGSVRNRMVGTPDSVFRDMSADIARGTKAGESIPQLRDRVQAFLNVSNAVVWAGRAETVARTESAGAYSAATIQAAVTEQRVLGETEPLDQVWIATIDGRTRRSHAAADGQRVPLGATFAVGGARLRYPGDPDGPPGETICCRCAVTVLDAADPLPGEQDRQTERGEGDATVRNRHGSRADQVALWEADGIVRARDDPDGIGVASAADLTNAGGGTAPATGAESVQVTASTTGSTSHALDGEEKVMEFRSFTAMLMPLGVVSRSGAEMAADNMQLVDTALPLPLKWQRTDDPGHDGGFTVGSIEQVEVRDGGLWGTGVMLNTAEADEAVEQVRLGVTQPSVEIVVREAVAAREDGAVIDDDEAEELWLSGEPVVMRMDQVELVGATLVSVPNFRETTISIDETLVERDESFEALVAAASSPTIPTPDVFDVALFANPRLAGPTPIHVTESGRVQGHLACWNSCHTAVRERCVTPYRSHSGYAEFHQSHVQTGDGLLRVGRLSVGGGHGPAGKGMVAAVEHYDNVATCWAYVRAGEDEHGIWVSGVVNPRASKELVAEAMSAPHSGHWERVGGSPELVAACAVNTPGFPIVTRLADRDGDLAMVASLSPRESRPPFDTTILRDVAREAVTEFRRQEAVEAQALARRAALDSLVGAASERRRSRVLQIIEGREGR